MRKVILAYSGGLDTSVAVAWLRETTDADVVTLTVDVGGGSLREGVAAPGHQRRRVAGPTCSTPASASCVDFCFPSAAGERALPGRLPAGHGPGPAADRPAPGRGRAAGGRRRGRPRLHRQGQRPGPLRRRRARPRPAPRGRSPRCASGWGCRASRRSSTRSARGIEIPITKASPYSIDQNLWGRSIETGVLEDPWTAPPADVYAVDRGPGQGAGDPGRGHHRLRGRHPGQRWTARRLSPVELVDRAPRARRPRTASAGSTTSRTGSSASRAARSTRRRRPSSSTRPTTRSRA